MARKYLAPFIFSPALALLVVARPVTAEVACVAEVGYRWVKEQSSAPQLDQAMDQDRDKGEDAGGAVQTPGAETPAPGAGTPSAAPPQQRQPGEQRMKFATIERRGVDEGAAKAGLLIEVNRQKARAHERCSKDHESFGECVGSKLSAKGTTLNSLSFSARVKLEEALIEECKVQQGRCLGVDSSEPTCRILVDPSAKSTAGAGEAGANAGNAAQDAEPAGKGAAEKGNGKGAGPAVDAAAGKAKADKAKP